MKNKLVKTIGTAAITILLTVIFGQSLAFAQGDIQIEDLNMTQTTEDFSTDHFYNRTMTGVWETVVTPRNCMTGEPVAPEFQGLSTYNEGGTYSEIAGGGNPVLRSPGHGIWKRDNRWQTFLLKFIFLRFNASGGLIGKQRVTQTVRLSGNGNQATSSGIIEVLDLNGNVLGSGCSTSTATRFE